MIGAKTTGESGMRRFVVTIPERSFELLEELAAEERRDVQEHAAWLLQGVIDRRARKLPRPLRLPRSAPPAV
jgi:hypothetical protein